MLALSAKLPTPFHLYDGDAIENNAEEMKAAFALYPVSMQQLIDIADTGNIMPPKTTWFEPKLRSGVVIHTF